METVLQVFAPPTVTISLFPATVLKGEPATLNWSSSGATSCKANSTWAGNLETNGTLTVSHAAAGSYVYEITCSGAGGAATSTATLTVNEPPSPAPVAGGANSGGNGGGGGGAFGAGFLPVLGLLLALRRRRLGVS
jgi:hypothetical protein